jgi:hypothetical protein
VVPGRRIAAGLLKIREDDQLSASAWEHDRVIAFIEVPAAA